MPVLTRAYLRLAVVYALVAMALGIAMSASHDFRFASVHAHLNLMGWASMALYGLVYCFLPQAAEGRLARVQFWLANAGVILLSGGVAAIALKMPEGEPVAAIGAFLTFAAMAIFAVVLFGAKAGASAQARS